MVSFIGDVHGKWWSYHDIISTRYNTYQVGDFGVGFPGSFNLPEMWKTMDKGFHVDNIFFMGGAESIDRGLRTPGYDWWPDEQVTFEYFTSKILPNYMKGGFNIVVTHDCPRSSCKRHCLTFKIVIPLTRHMLQILFDEYQPDLWVFGHWHKSVRKKINGTEFVCLAELEVLDL
jgi:Icc-related predicted phosphoesterase